MWEGGGGIHKQENATTISHYKNRGCYKSEFLLQISLCNLVYKTILKIIMNRFIRILQKMLSLWQGAFIPRRMIQDNAIIAQNVIGIWGK